MVIQATQASLEGIRVPGLGWKLVCNLGASRSRLLDGGTEHKAPRGAWVSSHMDLTSSRSPTADPAGRSLALPHLPRQSAFTATTSWLSLEY